MKFNQTAENKIENIISQYIQVIQGLEEKAKNSKKRAYGGVIRSEKGNLVENIITEQIVRTAWQDVLGQDSNRLVFKPGNIKVPIKKEYVDNLKDETIKKHIIRNLRNYHYPAKVDKHIWIDDRFVVAIECKAYTENAMLKRILVDFTLLRRRFPDLKCVLLQLESQLRGDYSRLSSFAFGSTSTHTLLSHFNVDLKIITLLEGEREVDRPIHKNGFFKPLTKESLINAVSFIGKILEDYR